MMSSSNFVLTWTKNLLAARFLMERLVSIALLLTTALVHADNQFKVGLSLPLSGATAEFGIAARNGIELARQQHPDRFEKIDFIYEDNRYDARDAISTFQKFSTAGETNLQFVWGSPTCLAVAPLAESSKTPLLCFSGDPKPGLKYVLSFNSMAVDYAEVVIADLQKNAPKSVAILYSSTPFFTNLTNAVVAGYSEKARLSLNMAIDAEARDLRPEVLRLKAANPDYLMLFILPSQVESISREMNLYKFKPYILGADTFADGSIAKASGGLFVGAPYVDMLIPEAFREQYRQRYGNTSGLSFAFNTYQFAQMIAAQFGSGEAVSAETVLLKLRGYHGGGEGVLWKESPENGQSFRFPIGMITVPPLQEQ